MQSPKPFAVILKTEMSRLEEQIRDYLESLEKTVNNFVSFFKHDKDFNQMVYTYWTVKDVLGHVTFWHESFARNLKDVAEKRKPNPLKGTLSDVNKMSVDTTRDVPIKVLCKRFLEAQKVIAKHIFNTTVDEIPYKKGSRNYSRLEHLQVVNSHIVNHLRDINNKQK
jgi:hypothetical protein